MKKQTILKPVFTNEEEQSRLTPQQKTAETKAKKRATAYELEEAPFFEETTHGFSFFPKQGASIITGHDVKKLDAETVAPFLQMTNSELKQNNVAFAVVKDKKGNVSFSPTLTRLESALTVALLAEFISQSRTFYDDVRAIGEAHKQNKKIDGENKKAKKQNLQLTERVEVPLARIGQNGGDFSDDFVRDMFAKYRVTPRDLFFDEKFRIYTQKLADDGGLVGFERDGVFYGINDYDDKHGVEVFFCQAQEAPEKVAIRKHEADKFIFLNLSKFWKKYFKTELSGVEYTRALFTVQNLGTKRVPCIDENKRFHTSQFFTTYTDLARHGREFFALLKLEAVDVFNGTETADDYLKLTENFEELLQNASDVEIRLWLDALNWRTERRKQKKCDKVFSCQELFERYGATAEVQARQFSRFWPKFRKAALKLTRDRTFLYFQHLQKPLTETTEAKPTDKVQFGVNVTLERHAPELNA